MYSIMEHQETALAFIDMNDDGMLVAYDVGCGKTMIALEHIHRGLKKGRIHNALVICPASLVGSWEQAIDDCVLFGYTKEEIDQLKNVVTVTSYQKTYHSRKIEKEHRDGSVTQKKEIVLRETVDIPWDVIICDESHNLGGHSSTQTRVCMKLARQAKKRIAMSGTPLHGGGGKQDWEKMYGQIQFITAGKRWTSWWGFCKECVRGFDKWHKPALWNDSICERTFKEYALSCRREDCIDLPGFVETKIPCELAEKKVYNDIKKGDFEKYHIKCEVAGSQWVKLLQVVSGSCKTEEGTMPLTSSKDEALENIINSTDDKIIVFCRYMASVDRCKCIGVKCGRNTTVYDGRSKGETWRDFQYGNSDLLIIQYDSGSAGLNLQGSHICVFFEPTLSALKLEQAAGRIYRKGQEEKCVYYFLTTPKTIEDKVWNLVRSGKDVNNDMLEKLAKGLL